MALTNRLRNRDRLKKPNNLDIISQSNINVALRIAALFTFFLMWDNNTVLALKRDDPPFSLNIKSSNYLPSNTVAESPRLLTVTKSSSQTRTTSTVSSWPSHKFLRSVLSRSDNVVTTKKRNRPSSTRKNHSPRTGVPLPDIRDNSTEKSKVEVRQRPIIKNPNKTNMKQLNYPKMDKENGSKEINTNKSQSMLQNGDELVEKNEMKSSQEKLILQTDKARSVALKPTSSENNRNENSTRISSQRLFSHPLAKSQEQSQEKQTKDKELAEETILIPRNKSETSALSEEQSSNINANSMHKNSHEYSTISSQVGFLYEIYVPPPPPLASLPLPKPPNTSFPPVPTTTAIYTTLHVSLPKSNSSGTGISKTTSISTSSAVTMNNGGKQVTHDDTAPTTSTFPPLSSSLQKTKGSRESGTSRVPMPHNFLSNKSKKVFSQNPQFPPTPTHKTQLNAYFGSDSNNEKVSFATVTRADPKNDTKTRAGIKRYNPSSINHNFGNVKRTSTTTIPFTTTKPFLSNLKIGRGQNSSNSNAYLTEFTTSVTPDTKFNSEKRWKSQPTQTLSMQSLQSQNGSSNAFRINGIPKNSTKLWNLHLEHLSKIGSDPNKIGYNLSPIAIQKKSGHPSAYKNRTTLIHRKNMFTVINKAEDNPAIQVEGRNATYSTNGINEKLNKNRNSSGVGNLPHNEFYDRMNQLERPLLTDIHAKPNRTLLSTVSDVEEEFYTEKDNDYFDEDDAQANLHHWIESEQGHSVSYSSELPKFTNLTWPYYISSPESSDDTSKIPSNGGGEAGFSGVQTLLMSPASTGLSVSFSKTNDKTQNFKSNYEFYIPSAAADPQQNPILVGKRHENGTTQVNFDSLSPKPTIPQSSKVKHRPSLGFQSDQHKKPININHLTQNHHKSKIKQTHWGSKGVNIKVPNSEKATHAFVSQLNQNNIKVYESSTGSPKSSTSNSVFPSSSTLFYDTPAKNSPTSIPSSPYSSIKHQKHFLTSPSPQSSSSWAFGSNASGQTEIASFVTAKTPTNIWYKPIINHFTASVPFNETSALYDYNSAMKEKVNGFNTGENDPDRTSSPGWSTGQPPTTKRKGYVGGDDDTSSVNSDNKSHKLQGGGSDATDIFHQPDTIKGPILFNIWKFADGNLKLENQREIPSWALNGYLLPQSGTILNLQQIPPALQPIVTNTIHKKDENLSYIWQKLPILGSFDGFTSATTKKAISTTETLGTTTTKPITTSTTTEAPIESLFDNGNNQAEIPSVENTGMGWSHENTETRPDKRPISINYVLWNNPASIYGQSIILSTPTPQLLLSSQPTPVSYFPSSTITPIEEGKPTLLPPVSPSVIIKNPGSSHTTPIPSSSSTMSQERLEALFQKYFQHFISTPATPATTSTIFPPLGDKVYGVNYGGSSTNNKAWSDLKSLILKLATSSQSTNKDSFTLDQNKAGDLEFLGNVASIALIMSYLRNQYDTALASSQNKPALPNVNLVLTTTTSTPYGVTDDMTPPHKDQLWATVYPLFQHYLNNPNFTYIPPPHKTWSTDPALMDISFTSPSSISSMTPTAPAPIPFTEPPTGGTTGNSDYYTRYNHYVTYSTSGARSSTARPTSISRIITKTPNHGATTSQNPRSESKLGESGDSDLDIQAEKLKTLLLIKKLKKKKKKLEKKKRKKKDKLASAIIGAALLKKISKPLLHVVKKPSKYMPVFMVLALGLIPLALSLVPLIYKMWWMKWRKPKYIKVKVPVPFPSPYPVYKYKPPPPPLPPYGYFHNDHDHTDIHGHSPPDDERRPEFDYGNDNNTPDIIHIDSTHQQHPQNPPPHIMDHHYAADSTGRDPNENSNEDRGNYAYGGMDHVGGAVNSFNYDYVKHLTPTHENKRYRHSHAYKNRNREDDQEVHVHLHDEESSYHPQIVSPDPPMPYTSYHEKDLQPYPATKPWEMGFDIGEKLAGMTNKQDMEILKILIDNKKEKINKLLDMWKLAKYSAGVASAAATNVVSNVANTVGGLLNPTTPLYPEGYSGKRKKKRRRRRRKKRKPSHENSYQIPTVIPHRIQFHSS